VLTFASFLDILFLEQLEVNKMANVNIRVDEAVKHQAEAVFAELGLSMSAATNIFYRQVARTGGIPFALQTDKVPMCGGVPDMTRMTKEQFDAEMQKGYDDILAGRVTPAEQVFAEMEERFERRRAK
jgi:addiction module RelB/DinJ family antitoxin